MAPFPYLDLHFTVRVDGEAPDLPFLGPTVRGLLGYGLRQRCCGHGADPSGRCPMGDACTYSYLFEAPLHHGLARENLALDGLPQPFIPLVQPVVPSGAARARRVEFGVRLLGDAAQLAPEVVGAVMAREHFGFGARSHGFRVEQIALGRIRIPLQHSFMRSDALEEQVQNATPQAIRLVPRIAVPEGVSQLRMRLATPLAIGLEGRPRDDWAGRIIDSAARRHWLLRRGYHTGGRAGSIPRAADTTGFQTVAADLRPYTIERRSSRHGRTVRLQAWTGELTVSGPWHHFAELLSAAAICGVGRSCSFGLGMVDLEALAAPSRAVRKPETRPLAQSELGSASRAARSRAPRWLRLRGTPPAQGQPRA